MDTEDPNAGRLWSEMDLFDLANCLRLKQDVEEIADFLCRPVGEEARRNKETRIAPSGAAGARQFVFTFCKPRACCKTAPVQL
jgi:hypothetical protein